MAKSPETVSAAAERTSFELEHFEWTADDRLEVIAAARASRSACRLCDRIDLAKGEPVLSCSPSTER